MTRLARIPEENPDPVFRISAGHVLLYRNPAGEELCRVWGCRLGQRVPTAIGTIVSAALADGAVARHEVAFGSRDYWLTVAPAVADGYVNLYARDVTDHKRTEEALRQAEQKFRTIFDNTSDGIFLHDLETLRLTMGNKSCLQMLGYTEEEFVKLGIADLHPEADLPFIYAQIEKFLKGGEPIRHDIRFKRKDGSILFADVSPDLVQLDGTRYALVALKDITERKRMEEELRRHAEDLEELVEARTSELQESETRYRSLYHTIADGIFVMGADGQIEDVNDSACAQLGYTREELIGMPVAAISARADFHPGEILDRLRSDRPSFVRDRAPPERRHDHSRRVVRHPGRISGPTGGPRRRAGHRRTQAGPGGPAVHPICRRSHGGCRLLDDRRWAVLLRERGGLPGLGPLPRGVAADDGL